MSHSAHTPAGSVVGLWRYPVKSISHKDGSVR